MSADEATGSASIPVLLVDSQLLTVAGEFISRSSKFLIAELMMYGAYFVLILIAVYTIIMRPQRSARTYWLVAALVVTFTVTTIMCFLDLAGCLFFYQAVFIENVLPMEERLDKFNQWIISHHVEVLGLWIGNTGDMGFLFLISDMLACWRALAIWQFPSRRILAFTQFFFIFSSFALWVACVGRQMTPSRRRGLPDDNAIVANSLIIASSTASIAANVVATAMMGYTALNKSGRAADFRAQGSKILLLLTESGVIYAMIQIIRLALTATPMKSKSAMTASSVFQSATQVVTAMYTPLLIILINYGYTIADTMQSDTFDVRNQVDGKQHVEGGGVGHQVSAIQFRRAARTCDTDQTATTGTANEGVGSP